MTTVMKNTLGLIGIVVHTVTPTDLATHWRNDVPVLATPILLWLAELACMRAIEGRVPEGYMTVGSQHACGHLSPTPAGLVITMSALVTAVTDRTVEFAVSADDGQERILSGKHIRGLVQRERFMGRVTEKALHLSQGGRHG